MMLTKGTEGVALQGTTEGISTQGCKALKTMRCTECRAIISKGEGYGQALIRLDGHQLPLYGGVLCQMCIDDFAQAGVGNLQDL